MSTLRHHWHREWAWWSTVFAVSPWFSALCFLLIGLTIAARYVAIISTAGFVGSLAGQSSEPSIAWLVMAMIALIVEPIGSNLLTATATAQHAKVVAYWHGRIIISANTPHGIAHLEDPTQAGVYSGLLDQLRGEFGMTCGPEAWRSLQTRASGLAALVLLVQWSILTTIGLFLAQLAMSRTFTIYVQTIQADLIDQASTDGRRANYLAGQPMRREAGKEVRLFQLTPWLLDAFDRVSTTAQVAMSGRRSKALRPVRWTYLLAVLSSCAAGGWLLYSSWTGVVTLTMTVAAAQAIIAMSAFGPLGDTSVAAARARTFAERFAALTPPRCEIATHTDTRSEGPRSSGVSPLPLAPAAPATPTPASVEFEAVSFTYPSRHESVFSNLSLHIPAGQQVALVGVNGVGKSTLIKILSGMYRPTCGFVRIDGMDPANDDGVRRRVSVIFQDFVRYHLSLRENVLLSLPSTQQADELAQQAMHAAAADDIAAQLDWDTVLDPGYQGGTDLSGGQWQRVALARAFAAVHTGAGILVLDEPTAALDVRVETEIFERFLESTRGVTSIIVSHRLSSVRHAERIIVLGREGALEDGSHEDLLAAGGSYAEMFELQARRFRQELEL